MFGRWWSPEQRAAWVEENDPEALAAWVQWREALDAAALLPRMTMPCLLIAGEKDPIGATARAQCSSMPNAAFVALPGVDHQESFYRSELVLPHVRRFLADQGRAAGPR